MTSTIVIVDDEKNIRRTVRMVLEGEGFAVEEASSGEEALARLPDIAPDVMLLDVQLPGISGHEVLESMRKARSANAEGEGARSMPSEPVVIMISGHGTLADAVRATKAGAYDFLEKPLDRERLMVTLRNALERRAMASEVAGLRAHDRGTLRDGGAEPGHDRALRPDRQGGADADARAHHRRVGDGQGAGRARHPPREPACATGPSSR